MKTKVVYRSGKYTHYTRIARGVLLNKLDIDDEILKNLTLNEIKKMFEDSILKSLELEIEVELNNRVLTIGELLQISDHAIKGDCID